MRSRIPDSPTTGDWDCSKFVEKDLCKAAKEELLKDDAEEVRVPRPETTSTPPAGFRVMFMAFILRGLSFLRTISSEAFFLPTESSYMT
jgi:hypothetical protein